MSALISCTCWCEAEQVMIPVEWVSEGRTSACSRTGCHPGCEITEHHDFVIDEADLDLLEQQVLSERKRKMNRFDPAKYNPSADSSAAIPSAITKQYPNDLLLVDGENLCYCGCGEERTGKGMFLMGHDMRLKGRLIRAYAAGVEHVVVYNATSGRTTLYKPLAYAASFTSPKLDWVQAVKDSAAKHNAKAAAKAERKATAKPAIKMQTVKVGRWEYQGLDNGDGTWTVSRNGTTKVVPASQVKAA